tara:strand:- start:7247 stop:7837 length:591 start_codon:yes stop_codon:yes gene_type:complete
MAYNSNTKQTTSTNQTYQGLTGPKNITIANRFGVQKLHGSYSADIIQALSELYVEQTISLVGIGPTIEDKSEEVLNALGFSIVKTEELSPGLSSLKEFSLIGSTNIDETIENSRIIDPNLNKLTPNPELATDKFKSESDPIYDLDEERSDSLKKKTLNELRQERRETISLAKKLATRTRKSKNKMLPRRKNRGIRR